MKAIFNKMFWQFDLIYLATASLACQFLPVSEIIRMLLSLPFFLIVPPKIGGFILSFSESHRSLVLKDPILGFAVDWCMGAISLFSFALLLQGVNLFNAYVFVLMTICILIFARIYFGDRGKPQLHNILKEIDTDLGDYRCVILSLLAGLIPIFLIYRYWPFPLKIASDAFGDNMLTLQITEGNLIDLFSSGIHPPMKPTLLSVPSLLFNVFPFNFEWGLPLVIFPIFSFVIYLFSYKISNNEFLSLFASIISVGAFGDGTAVHLYAVHQRDIVMLLFPIATLLILKKIRISEETSSKGYASILQIAAFSLLSYSTMEVSLAPSENRLPPIFLGMLYVVFLFLFFSDIFRQRFRNVIRCLSVAILILFIVYFCRFFYFLRPDFLSWSYLWTAFGVVSAALLIAHILFPSIIIKPKCDNGFVVISLCALLFHPQLGIFMVITLLIVTTVYHFAQYRRLSMKLVWLFIGSILSLIILEKSGLISFFSILPKVADAFSFDSSYRLLEEVFTSSILILFMFGALFSLIYRRVKETYILFVGCSFLLFYFMPIVNSFRAIIFIVPIVAYFAANTFQTWNNLFPARIVRVRSNLFFNKLKTTMTLKKSHVFFLILLLIFLPTIIQPYTRFIDNMTQREDPLYTFDYYEYDVAQWIHKHTPQDVLVISEPFTARAVCRLSNRGLIITQLMIYDEKGHTHSIGSDLEIVNKTKRILTTENATTAITEMLEIRETYYHFEQLNKKLGSPIPIDSIPIIIIINGRTTEWVKSNGLSDVIFPRKIGFLPSYEKFFESSYFDLLYENDGQIFVFELRMDLVSQLGG